MKWFLNLNTSVKLFIGFGLCLTLSAIMGGTAIVKMNQINNSTKLLADDALAGSIAVSDVLSNVKQYRIYEYRHLLETSDAEMTKLESAMNGCNDKIVKDIADYKATANQPDDIANANKLKPLWDAYATQHAQQIQLGRQNNDKAGAAMLTTRFVPYKALTDELDIITQWNKDRGALITKEAAQIYAAARTAVLILLALAILTGVAISMFVSKLLTRAITEVSSRLEKLNNLCVTNLGKAVEALAQGDLTPVIVTGTTFIDVRSSDDLGRMAECTNGIIKRTQGTVAAFEAARASLSEVMATARMSTDSITRASDEVAMGTTDLSQRTEEQASSLEETASSMEEMTSTVKQNADNARYANQLAAQAKDIAETGGSVVSSAVTAMAEINEGSKRIADIISVIDEIAFQTNLLALNAAVEAARVGEQGRGFAVVAAEVRSLAGRSATAAKEIKALVQDSVAKVGEGSELVNQSGEQLTEIVSSVKKVADIIAEISAASTEQSAGIETVNKAVMQMDQITQQNAALVEESAAASASMAHQAKDLQTLVSRFQIDSKYLSAAQQSSMAGTVQSKATGTYGGAKAAARKAPRPSRPTLEVVSGSGDGFEEF